MKLERILPFARTLLEKAVKPGDITVNPILGNGHDKLILANLVGPDGEDINTLCSIWSCIKVSVS